ncbi:MAG: SDR family oxidoreductase [Candidatus Zixiibacteriota bacterium]|nr:MAG: SDR family oxidoreductase [candidate division Zixibacteria bacterium]
MTILVLGATGYVGGRLVPGLLERGHRVRCLTRDPLKVSARPWSDRVEIVPGDVLSIDSLRPAMDGVDVVYYLVHSMAAGLAHFESLDRVAAENAAAVAAQSNVKRIIYLGGLGRSHEELSPHLRSRHEVGAILRRGSVPVTEFRAAVIVGSGSLSFEMIHHLVNRLPVMICPRWVYTRTQPIGIEDVLTYLAQALDRPETTGQILDIGGPDIMSYGEMMMSVARLLGLKRKLISVPLLTPRLSSYWINLVTPLQTVTARALIDSLRHETVCSDRCARSIFDFEPTGFEQAALAALGRLDDGDIETTWIDASSVVRFTAVDQSHIRIDERDLDVTAPPRVVFDTVSSIGGNNGWYYADWLWKVRGFVDKQLGGVGLRRGRRHPRHLRVGDALDFWRVAELESGRRLLLRAEMKVWGEAWLEFKVEANGDSGSRLRQTARYYPQGLWGHLYWYLVYPVHISVFRGLIRAIARRAEAAAQAPRT